MHTFFVYILHTCVQTYKYWFSPLYVHWNCIYGLTNNLRSTPRPEKCQASWAEGSHCYQLRFCIDVVQEDTVPHIRPLRAPEIPARMLCSSSFQLQSLTEAC